MTYVSRRLGDWGFTASSTTEVHIIIIVWIANSISALAQYEDG